MLTKTRNAVAGLVMLLLMAGTAQGNGNADTGRLRFSVCGACHGLQGQGNEELGAPRIAGLPSWYTARQLQSFATGLRGGPISDKASRQMAIFALNLSAADIADLSAFLESVPHPAALQGNSIDPDLQRAGQAAYQQCAVCHGPDAEGAEALGAPPLRGLNAWYFRKQLNDFKSGIRGYDIAEPFAASMRAIAQSIDTEETADAIAAYLHLTDR